MNYHNSEPPDDASIKPVSSLRSLFETKSAAQEATVKRSAQGTTARQPSPLAVPSNDNDEAVWPRFDGRFSLDMPRSASRTNPPAREDLQVTRFTGINRKAPEPPTSRSSSRSRPLSMGPLSPPRSPPKLTVESPNSPPKTVERRPISPFILLDTPVALGHHQGTRDSSPASERSQRFQSSRNGSPARMPQTIPMTRPLTASLNRNDPGKSSLPSNEPPPVNRAGKPKNFPKTSSEVGQHDSLAPTRRPEQIEEKASPFSTPPSSDPSPPELGASSRVSPYDTFSRLNGQRQLESESSRQGATARWRRPDVQPPTSIQPVLQQATERAYSRSALSQSDLPENRPSLPSRRDRTPEQVRFRRENTADVPTSLSARQSTDLNNLSGSLPSTHGFMPPPKRASTLTSDSEEPRPRTIVATSNPHRASSDMKRIMQEERRGYTSESDADMGPNGLQPHSALPSDYPDSSQSNRRPPIHKHPPHEIPTKYDTKLFAVTGEYLCTSGYLTRAWNISTGEVLMTLSHGETVKMTALAFKPVPKVEDEGKRIWLGSSTGDIHEVDISSQRIVATRSNAHAKREIIKIYRHASNMWTLDEDGKVMIWTPDAEGSPNLSMTPRPFTLGKGHTFSILSGNNLWHATGKDIRVWYYDALAENLSQLTTRALSPPGCGEITSGSSSTGQSNRLFFGHADGKISIFSTSDFSCLGVVNLSLYRISTLVGVGDYLWAGYNTGKIYVYDTSSKPWKVKKDWNAHGDRIAGIALDRTSLWKLDRLQVVSLGTDNCLKIWDGMLREDCLEADMQAHDVDFCDFREISATVMTWNAGAAKPTWLRQEGSNVFQELLSSGTEAPDILVFGFQELVDLEKKSLTAKSFFKRSKKKDVLTDGSVQEHMSHQYRMWRDHLERELALHVDEPYVLLHNASLIGLFSCVFVKASERQNIRDVNAAEIKLGMGGHYGNKGALVVRFILDDSSLCFVNCHLAAGQTQTASRNNDIATIMESSNLPQKVSSVSSSRSDLFVGGGDGRMILDHEICILNGDLNYRIDTLPRDQVIAAAKQGHFAKLLERDQLLLSRKRNPGFRLRAFTESPLTFAPTYKYDVGSDNYDSSEKKRSPAWCDRVLYKGYGSIRQLDYRRHEVRVSDHRPVSASFRLRIKTIDSGRRRTIWEDCEDRFEEVKRRIALSTKLDYLVNVLGCTEREAQRLLKK